MSDQDAFEHVLAAMYDAVLDDARWPAASALIDEACGVRGNRLFVAEGPKADVRGLFVGFTDGDNVVKISSASTSRTTTASMRPCRECGSCGTVIWST